MKIQVSLLCLAIASALAVAPAAQAANTRRADVVNRANALLNANASAFHRASADAFSVRDVIVDRDGTEHVRYDRTWNGLPVIGGDFVAHSRNGRLTRVSQTLRSAQRPSLNGRITRDQAIVEAGAHFGSRFDGAPTARTVVYARDTTPVLAYEVVFKGTRADQTPTEMHYFVDASSARILDQWDTVNTARPGPGRTCRKSEGAVGTGNSLFVGEVTLNTSRCLSQSEYSMVDTTRGGGATYDMHNATSGTGTLFTSSMNVWGDGTMNDRATVAADAHFGVAATWDYYLTTFGRAGIADDGKGAVSRVHVGNNWVNATWSDSCFCMSFGDGDPNDSAGMNQPIVVLDVAGHEMTHGVTSRSAGLVYSGESGGLNEATSDIMGTMVEFFVNDAADPGDYLIGEKTFGNNDGTKALRYMFKPSLDAWLYNNTPGYVSQDCYSAGIGNMDVHFSSGVANHFIYLLAEGAVVPAGFGAGTDANLTANDLVCNGNTGLTAIGRVKAAAIWYKALTEEMTSSTNYAGARTATLVAAEALYGAGSPEVSAVDAAWAAVNVGGQLVAPPPQTPAPNRTPRLPRR